MTADVAIVDYGLGNLFSIQQACKKNGVRARITGEPDEIRSADVIILPGVGAFGRAMDALAQLDLIDILREQAAVGKPFFGICLGMQLLFESSEEDPGVKGLGLLKGAVRLLPNIGKPIPNIGWQTLAHGKHSDWHDTPFQKLDASEEPVYLLHSYFAEPSDPSDILAITEWGSGTYCCAVIRGNVFGCQFHPEKSGEPGLQIFREFFDRIK